jgi:hypothetical protein
MTGFSSYGPLQRRLLALVGVLCALMVALVVFRALHGSGDGVSAADASAPAEAAAPVRAPAPAPTGAPAAAEADAPASTEAAAPAPVPAEAGAPESNPVAAAAARTEAEPGARLTLDASYTAKGSSLIMTGSGKGDWVAADHRTDFSLTVPVVGGSPAWAESISTGDAVYMRSSRYEGHLPAGMLWVRSEPLIGYGDLASTQATNADADAMLAMVKATGDAKEAGAQSIHGEPTTRYEGTVEAAAVAALLREEGEPRLARSFEVLATLQPAPIPIEVWIDSAGLIRQVGVVEKIPGQVGPEVTMNLRMGFYAFGHRAEIPVPAARQAYDYRPALRGELRLEDGTHMGPLAPPAGTPALSVAEFHRQASAICRRLDSEVRGDIEHLYRFAREVKALPRDAATEERLRVLVEGAGVQIEEPLYEVLDRGWRDLGELSPPAAYAADMHRYLTIQATVAEWVFAQSRAYRLGVVGSAGIDFGLHGREAEEAKGREIGRRLGLTGCVAADPTSTLV